MTINSKQVFHKGYEIYKAKNTNLLVELRKKIYLEMQKIFKLKEINPEKGLNNFHKIVGKLSNKDLNSKRKKLIENVTKKINFGEIIFKTFEEFLVNNLGPDILVQRNCNIVIQMPHDPNPSEIHRDAPLNSAYEIVAWVPLVDCYKTKAMYILDYPSTKKSLKFLKDNSKDWKKFENYSKYLRSNPKVKFGQGLFFSSCLIHGSDINIEKETRISLNIRFKSLFSPAGKKNQLQYFKSLKLGNISNIGIDFESGNLFD
jgi:sporadic carbohydrate cluster 2OG-Fe(II) oxygenase